MPQIISYNINIMRCYINFHIHIQTTILHKYIQENSLTITEHVRNEFFATRIPEEHTLHTAKIKNTYKVKNYDTSRRNQPWQTQPIRNKITLK